MKQIAASIALAALFFLPASVRCAENPASPLTAPSPAEPVVKDNHKMMKMMSGMEQGGGEVTKTPISGKVAEVMTGGGYTYLFIDKDGQKTWVAIPEREIQVGKKVTVMPGTVMSNFQSKALNLTFDRIIFSDGVDEQISNQAVSNTPDQTAPITGKILETMTSGSYTYVLLKNRERKENIWLAVPAMKVVVGAEMTFAPGTVMTNFPSKALDRTFDRIVFSSGPVQQKEKKKAKKAPKNAAAGKVSVTAAEEKISVEKAEGANAYRVAELFKFRKKLNKKKVVVQGKVVSISANIMKKNWIHLQDGSGDPKKANNDLVVTSQALPVEGDIVTASGSLHMDVTMGTHKFPVVVEDAEIVIK